ncbi:YadA-like family protein [Qipengyuania gaetbuli]|uniref:YadA-like family protein n=1 Tax=Qipengyuania gaetbuli TaxID=266952 RepID=UPI001CD39E24|nr:YadA-like family protein [Qipengyuania gaetbuli]MCA0909819.1 YadA-like family protein [Qipengyuania gaetbuli]
MRTMNNAGRAICAGLMTSVAGGALIVAVPASAQSAETCFRDSGGNVYCDEPNDFDYLASTYGYAGINDGAYDNLDSKIEQTAPSEAEVEAAQAELDAANENATTLTDAQSAVEASLTDENLEAFADVDTAEAALASAQGAEAAAGNDLNDAQVAFDVAADDLTDANQGVTAAQVAISDAQDAVDAAQAAYDADQTPENLAALNAALADRADAQLALVDAEEARADALAAANAASADLTAAQTAFNDAVDARVAAADDLSDALTALDTSLASNDDFVDAITDAGYTADAAGLTTLTGDAEAATVAAAVEQQQFDALDDATNTYIRAQEVLVAAAENENAAIAAASQALLGDPRADETNSEVEVIAALVDHEGRITANEATLVDHEGRITANEATLVDHETRITANEATLVDHEGRITTNEANIASNTARITVAEATLVEHDARITTNATNIASNTARIVVAEATLVEHDERITANSAAIVAEAETRAAADAQLLERITAEENARIAADNAIMAQITDLGGRVGAIETRIDQLDDRISSSTATAIALGGMGFLPDTKFNLSVAGGFYEGANAIAANAGIRVSNNIAITAGIGGGLNKDGKVGGRVGVIFGW